VRIAILSDIHGNRYGFDRCLADAQEAGVDHLACLGDVGADLQLLTRLRDRGITCTFGNWEVNGLRRMDGDYHDWVAAWPATVELGAAIFCHATPDMPPGAQTTAAAAQIMRDGLSLQSLFPRLHRDEDALWMALARLEETNSRVAFHGHTHIQLAWSWCRDEKKPGAARRLRSFTQPTEFVLEPGSAAMPNRYVIGVGSCGQPQDGYHYRYVLYDDDTGLVQLRAVN